MKKELDLLNLEKTNFETALSKLEEIVEKLSGGDVDLENMIKLYQDGIVIKNHCLKQIKDAKIKVDVLMEKDSSE